MPKNNICFYSRAKYLFGKSHEVKSPMPFDVLHPVAGCATYAAIKFGGYTAAAAVLEKTYEYARVSPAVAGLTRTGIGLLVGPLYMAFLFATGIGDSGPSRSTDFAFVLGLIPVRLAEWLFLIWLYYHRTMVFDKRDWLAAVTGTIWSFILDALAFRAVLVTAGILIC